MFFFFSSRRRHTRSDRDWSSDVCSSDLAQPGAVGLVGEPTADFVAAIQGAWLAGESVSILPGPVRGADPQRWAQSTVTRFTGIGVRTVLSHGPALELLRSAAGPL